MKHDYDSAWVDLNTRQIRRDWCERVIRRAAWAILWAAFALLIVVIAANVILSAIADAASIPEIMKF